MSGNFAEKLDFCSRVVVFFLFLQKRIIIFKKNTIHNKDKYNLKGGETDMKKKLALLLSLLMIFSFTVLTACGGTNNEDAPAEESAPAAEENTADAAEEIADAAEHGYAGSDPVEAAVYEYVADELSEGYSDAEYNIPIVSIVGTDDSNASDILVWGDFWVINYNGEGDTLKAASGGDYPGLIHLKKDDDEYEVVKMDMVADGGNFESSAKEIFGDKYDAFMKVNSDSEAREKLRAETIANFVKANSLNFTKYQDEGWDPVDIPL